MATLEDHGSPLFEGQRLDQPTFHELYLLTPESFRAELIDGVVFLENRPVSTVHGRPHARLIGLLGLYACETPGSTGLARSTIILGPRSEVEPDATLLIDPDSGGATRESPGGFVTGSPELVVEVEDDSPGVDLEARIGDYERAGIAEVLVYDAVARECRWLVRRGDRFEPLPKPDGVYRSEAFPGLWFSPDAFCRDDDRASLAILRRGLKSAGHRDFVGRLRENRANRP